MKDLDLIDVVSAGDVATTHLRIEKALREYSDGGARVFVLNGFNNGISGPHDSDFEGETWRDDFRLVDIYRDLEKEVDPTVLYARNTIENGLGLRNIVYGKDWDIETVTSKTHLSRLKKMYWYVFPDGEFEKLSFVGSKEPSYLKNFAKETVKNLMLPKLMSGIKRGFWDVDKQYAAKRYGEK